MSWLVETGTPTEWKKLTTWWPDCSHKISSVQFSRWVVSNPLRQAATILRTGLREMGMNHGTEDELYLKQWKQCWSDHQWPVSRWQSELTVLFLRSLVVSAISPSVYKCSWPLIVSGGGVGVGRGSSTPPPVASIQNKANFPFHQPGLFTGLRVLSSQNPLSVTDTVIWYLTSYYLIVHCVKGWSVLKQLLLPCNWG